MPSYPYRVKRLRLLQSCLVDNERDLLQEEAHRVVIWRISDSEFRIVRHVSPTAPKMASIDQEFDRSRITAVFVHQVREALLYGKGEPLPWPEVTSPPDALDDAKECADALKKSKTAKKEAA